MLYSFLRKWKGWKGVDPRAQAIASWTACEDQNSRTNARLGACFRGNEGYPLNFISEVQRKIESVIGSQPLYERLDLLCRWSGGATFDLRRGSDIADKMSNSLTVTPRAVPHLIRILNSDHVWHEALGAGWTPTLVDGNRCVTVPKTSKTDRMIAAEPTANAFLQQAVGRFFRFRLKGFGVDLDDQTVNQDLAFRARVDGLSTLDLSSASDTLSYSLVELLLPPAWFEYLCDLRSPKSRLDGKWYLLEKFSSMGNAFTFELESLIFWAITKVVCELGGHIGPVSVYGDDIICPQGAYDDVSAALKWAGFSVNQEKSYHTGSFYESCGRHYFELEDVTPVYQKESVGNDLFELVRLHNRLYRWGKRNGMHLVKDACRLVLDESRSRHKRLPFTPFIEADLGFITDDAHRYKVDRHGDFRCLVIDSCAIIAHRIGNSAQLSFYAYKLRDPAHSNTLPDGNVGLLAGERRFLTTKRIWATQLLA
jgi:hypothetical protein